MKKLLFILTLVLLLVGTAYAKIVDLEMEFSMDAEFLPYVDSYKLYSEIPGTGDLINVANFPKSDSLVFQVTALDLPPGKITNFYISAVYGIDSEAVEDMSLSKPFKYTGKPIWIRINKR